MSVLEEIAAERLRQSQAEGGTPQQDDTYRDGQLAGAAACYALTSVKHWAVAHTIPTFWPWAKAWWKPKNPRRDLIRAAALIVAEIERIDRAVAVSTPADMTGTDHG
jgi:hypothetical protein